MAEYADRDIVALDLNGGHYSRHVQAMTREGLDSKSAIAAELAWRDAELSRLRAEANDAARYRAFFDAGLPITFLGESYETKEELDAAIDRARSAAQGGSDV